MTKRMRGTMRRWSGYSAVVMGLLLGLGMGSARAATLTVGSATVDGVGATASIPLNVDDAAGIESADLTISYPTSIVSPLAPTVTAMTANCLVSSNLAGPGVMRVALACGEAPTGSGALLNLPVQGVAAGGPLPATLDACSLVEDSCPVRSARPAR
jgi:hypothetical protein